MKIRIAKLWIHSERTGFDKDYGHGKIYKGWPVLVRAGITTGLHPMNNQERRALWREKKALIHRAEAAILKDRQSHPLYL